MKLKKLVSVILILSILFTFSSLNFGFTASAQTEYTEGYYTYTVKNGKATITKCDTSISGDVLIPTTLGGYSVYKIGYYAFFGCSNLINLTLPNGLVSIENEAFSHCSNLKSVFIPDSVMNIGSYAFYGCSSLKNVVIPNSVTSLGYLVFAGNSTLESITLPIFGEYINEPNSQMGNLGSVFGPDFGINYSWAVDEEELPYYALYGNYDGLEFYKRHNSFVPSTLKSVEISEGFTELRRGAFAFCDKITSITLPVSLKFIENYTFYNCSNLKDIYYNGNELQWSKITVSKEMYPYFEKIGYETVACETANNPLYKATIHYTYSDTECDEHTYLSKDSERCGVCGKERTDEKTEKPNISKPSQSENSSASKPNNNSKNEVTSSKDNATNNSGNVSGSNTSKITSGEKAENPTASSSGTITEGNINSQESKTDSTKNESLENNENTLDSAPEGSETDKFSGSGGTLLWVIIAVLIVLSLCAVVLFVLYKKGIIILNKK